MSYVRVTLCHVTLRKNYVMSRNTSPPPPTLPPLQYLHMDEKIDTLHKNKHMTFKTKVTLADSVSASLRLFTDNPTAQLALCQALTGSHEGAEGVEGRNCESEGAEGAEGRSSESEGAEGAEGRSSESAEGGGSAESDGSPNAGSHDGSQRHGSHDGSNHQDSSSSSSIDSSSPIRDDGASRGFARSTRGRGGKAARGRGGKAARGRGGKTSSNKGLKRPLDPQPPREDKTLKTSKTSSSSSHHDPEVTRVIMHPLSQRLGLSAAEVVNLNAAMVTCKDPHVLSCFEKNGFVASEAIYRALEVRDVGRRGVGKSGVLSRRASLFSSPIPFAAAKQVVQAHQHHACVSC